MATTMAYNWLLIPAGVLGVALGFVVYMRERRRCDALACRMAGSRLTLDRAVRNAEDFGAMTQLEAVAAATLRPAQLLGVERERGTFRPGARADLVVLDAAGGVAETWLAGERAYTRHEGDGPFSSHTDK